MIRQLRGTLCSQIGIKAEGSNEHGGVGSLGWQEMKGICMHPITIYT
jgi:hypothetical protein